MTASTSIQRRMLIRRESDTGFTLIELLVGLVSSTLLVAGLTSAVYISSQALDLDSSISRKSAIASEVLGELTADLALTRSFSERTATAVTFDVPDRNGDLLPETIRYAWSGTSGDSADVPVQRRHRDYDCHGRPKLRFHPIDAIDRRARNCIATTRRSRF